MDWNVLVTATEPDKFVLVSGAIATDADIVPLMGQGCAVDAGWKMGAPVELVPVRQYTSASAARARGTEMPTWSPTPAASNVIAMTNLLIISIPYGPV